jgi:uncharacterized OB-fold protein
MSNEEIEAILDQDPYVTHHPQLRPFWRAAAEGRFMVPRCRSCGRAHWYPRMFCPFCASEAVVWENATGIGRIYACSMLEREAGSSILAYIQLDEGPIIMSNLVDCKFGQVAIDDKVAVLFRKTEHGRSVPVFSPVLPASGNTVT